MSGETAQAKAKAAREEQLLKRMEELEAAASSDPALESVRLATYESLLEEYTRLVDDGNYVPSELVNFGTNEASFDAQLQSSARAARATNGVELPTYQEALESEDDSLAKLLKNERKREEEIAKREEEDRLFAEQLSKQFEAEAAVAASRSRPTSNIDGDRQLAELLGGNYDADRKFAELLQKEETRFATSEAEGLRLARLLQQEGELLRQAIDFRKTNGLAPDAEEDRKFAEFLARQEKMDQQLQEEAENEAKRQVEIAAAKRRVAELTHKQRVHFNPKQEIQTLPPKQVRDAPDIIACESLDDLMPPEVDVSNLSQGFIRVPQRFLDIVVGPAHRTLKMIEKQTSTIIRAPQRATMPNQSHTTFFVFGTPAQIAAAKAKMTQLMQANDDSGSLSREKTPTENNLHVFIDYSSALYGCRTFGSANATVNPSLQLDLGRLIEIIEHGRPTKTRGIAGANILENDLAAAVNIGYSAWVSDPSHVADETYVDAKLHPQILQVVANQKDFPPPQTLIIVTGNGPETDDEPVTNFPRCAESALTNDWIVEVWSWKHCIPRQFIALQVRFPDFLKIFYLDDYAVELVVPDFD